MTENPPNCLLCTDGMVDKARYMVSIREVKERWPSQEQRKYEDLKETHYAVFDITFNPKPIEEDRILDDPLARAVDELVKYHRGKYQAETSLVFSNDPRISVEASENLDDLISRPPTVDELRELNRAVLNKLYKEVKSIG